MNDFVAAHPAITVAFVACLITLFGFVTLGILKLGYSHMMRRFNGILEDEKLNRKEHRKIRKGMKRHGHRLVRIETLVINGGKK